MINNLVLLDDRELDVLSYYIMCSTFHSSIIIFLIFQRFGVTYFIKLQ